MSESTSTSLRDTLPAVAILGAGAVTHLGRGLAEIASQLSHENSLAHTQPAAGPGVTPKAVDDALLFDHDPKLNRKLRRADRHVRMSCFAALDAWPEMDALNSMGNNNVGMIIASGFGPHQRGFRFLDGLLDHGDQAASPTDFSHSVHGSASAYISGLLELRGPTFSITDFRAGFAQAVQLAQCWIQQHICEQVLVGATEELGAVLLSVARQCLPPGTHYNAGEGSVFLLLGNCQNNPQASLKIEASSQMTCELQNVDLLVGQDNAYLQQANTTPAHVTFKTHTSFADAMGDNASTLAFETLGSILAMNNPALPIHRLNLNSPNVPTSTRPAPVGNINSAMSYVSLAPMHSPSLLLTRNS